MSENTQSIYQIQWQTVEHLRSFIESMKAEKQSVYIRKIKDLEDELKKLKKFKRYGLVWEDKPEDVVDRCKTELPVLVGDETKTIEENPNGPTHILIEWDNYHALSVLAYTHEKKVDVVYIDPPYNTWKKDFIYNDRFVDKEDTFRHSKWLSFMTKRLEIAKRLLKDTGVIFISIDDNEQTQLKLLCDEIFWEDNFINNFMWLHWKWKKDKHSRTLQQYILCFCKNKNTLEPWSETKEAIYSFSNPDKDPKWDWFSGSVSFSEERSNIKNKNYYSIQSPSWIIWKRQWQIWKDEMDEYISSWDIFFWYPPEYDNVPRLKVRPWKENELIPWNILSDFSTQRDANNEVVSMWLIFDNPKPTDLLKHILKISSKPNSLILDFFAWSWTTWHAVLKLNKEDGGNRQFILCTNNENKIAEEVTYPRIRNVIQGYGDVPGIPANLRYYRTDFVPLQSSMDDLRRVFVERSTEMLCIRENCFDNIKCSYDMIRIFSSQEKHLVILYDPFEIASLRGVIEKTEGDISVYVFSLSPEIFSEVLSDLWSRIHIETIPDPILETYKVIFGF